MAEYPKHPDLDRDPERWASDEEGIVVDPATMEVVGSPIAALLAAADRLAESGEETGLERVPTESEVIARVARAGVCGYEDPFHGPCVLPKAGHPTNPRTGRLVHEESKLTAEERQRIADEIEFDML